MDFSNAVKMMRQGVAMTRMDWDDPEEKVLLEDAQFMKQKDGRRYPIVFFSHEILATDWEVVRTRGEPEAEER